MKYGRILFALATFALTACDNSSTPATVTASQAAVGTFQSNGQIHFPADDQDGRRVMFITKEFMTIGNNSVTVRRSCKIKGDKTGNVTIVEETVPAQVNATHFVISKPIAKEVLIGKFKCAIERAAGVWEFKIDDNFLSLKSADGASEDYGYEVGKKRSIIESLRETGAAVGDSIYNFMGNHPPANEVLN